MRLAAASRTGSNAFKHGLSHTPEYMAWSHMKDRCYNSSSNNYTDYGRRGIRVCDRWLESFENFIEDMELKPTNLHTLDRIDVNGDYEPSNCRWATRETQSINRRLFKNSTSGFTGVSLNKRKGGWVAYIYHKKNRLHLGSFKTITEAVSARKEAEAIYGR